MAFTDAGGCAVHREACAEKGLAERKCGGPSEALGGRIELSFEEGSAPLIDELILTILARIFNPERSRIDGFATVRASMASGWKCRFSHPHSLRTETRPQKADS